MVVQRGAEIEKVVKSAIEKSFFEKRELTAAAKRIVPVASTMKAQIDELRAWANGRAIPAGHPLESQPKAASKKTEIEL